MTEGFLDSYMDIKDKDFDLTTIMKDGHLFISNRVWKSLNERYTREQIMEFMSNAVEKYNIPVPMKDISVDDCYTEFLQLRALDTKSLIHTDHYYTKVPYYEQWTSQKPFYIAKDNTGNKASDYFQQENRMKCSGRSYPSPYDSWHNKKTRETAFKPIWTLKMDQVDRGVLLTSIQMKHYIASQFRPSSAKAFYEYFQLKNVLDFSSGWGDRLCGFFASNCTELYLGCDPNRALHPQYQKQIDFYTKHVKNALNLTINKRATVLMSPAEDADIPENSFDGVFTSPPYLDVEKYSDDKEQSFARYKTTKEWLDGFLFPTIKKCWKSLKYKGVFGINISDVIKGKNIEKICDPLNEYFSKLSGANYYGMCGYEISARPNTGYDKSEGRGKLCEPLWIWRKLQ